VKKTILVLMCLALPSCFSSPAPSQVSAVASAAAPDRRASPSRAGAEALSKIAHRLEQVPDNSPAAELAHEAAVALNVYKEVADVASMRPR